MLTQQCTNQCACTEIPPSSSSVLFREAVRTENMKLFNASMSASRIAVKWLFGDVYNYFKFLDYKKNLVCKCMCMWFAQILRNALNSLYGNQTAEYFQQEPPTLEGYFV